jgi:hypothetical protein
MRLFEVDQGSALEILRVLKGLANKDGQASTIPWPAVQKTLAGLDLGISTPDALIKLANDTDPEGKVFSVSKDEQGNIILNTDVKDPKQAAQDAPATGPSVDRMAKSNSDLSSKI